MSNIIPNPSEKRDLKKAYILAFFCLIAITCISHLLPGKIKVDVLYVCCVLLVVGQPIKRIIIYSLIACCLILITHLTLNRTLPLSWVAFVNAGISIIAALITSYVANRILSKNKLLEHRVAEKTKNLSEINSTLEESQSQLRTIFNTTDIAFLLLDSDLQILTYNAIANHWSELLFGAQLQKGGYFWTFLDIERKEPVRDMMQLAMTGHPINYEACYPLLHSGVSEWYQISMNPVKDQYNNIIGICCSAINVTSNKMAEMERSQIADDLVQRNKDLEQFAYIVSHNLRAPLANVIGLAQILKQNELTLNEKAQTENLLFQSILKLDEIVRELNHVLQNRLKINEKKENVVFSELLHDVLISFLLIMKYENILILPDFSKARELFTIKGYLYNIFFNLISNSIKYRRPDKQLIIEIRSWIENDKIKISIKDNGLVVDLNNKGNGIFGLYKNQSDIEAKGIDLFLVNNQVGLLGGNIDIQSEPDAGNDFLIILPLQFIRSTQKQS
ncbi:PAS domain-containing sensor histidine kinase [Mucilaginibacter sp.]|uniref:sensor histidine kinase n=1 Tax=Mucilaginibacter sp. TaxID=1882438 RepID=UPI0026020747|nr:PAS domain-containing sensor histidine kinase [Mucilaginibacter sp.]MDB5029343.1 putative two-component hybrid sensor and regulator [Mucilaginibacter sp.]